MSGQVPQKLVPELARFGAIDHLTDIDKTKNYLPNLARSIKDDQSDPLADLINPVNGARPAECT